MSFEHEIRVRYGECDMQRVVFNANYFAYIDDAVDTWFRAVLGSIEDQGFDFMVKKATLTWHSAAVFGETLVLRPHVSRWGTTSFDVTVDAHVGERHVLSAELVYVSTTPGAPVPHPIPDKVRAALA